MALNVLRTAFMSLIYILIGYVFAERMQFIQRMLILKLLFKRKYPWGIVVHTICLQKDSTLIHLSELHVA